MRWLRILNWQDWDTLRWPRSRGSFDLRKGGGTTRRGAYCRWKPYSALVLTVSMRRINFNETVRPDCNSMPGWHRQLTVSLTRIPHRQLQENDDALSMWGPDEHKKPVHLAAAQLFLMSGVLASIAGFIYLIQPDLPAARRMYPYEGLVKELSGTDDQQYAVGCSLAAPSSVMRSSCVVPRPSSRATRQRKQRMTKRRKSSRVSSLRAKAGGLISVENVLLSHRKATHHFDSFRYPKPQYCKNARGCHTDRQTESEDEKYPISPIGLQGTHRQARTWSAPSRSTHRLLYAYTMPMRHYVRDHVEEKAI